VEPSPASSTATSTASNAASLALYRRYRPETFNEVIGQDHVTGPLRSALANNRVNHAYLFSGPRGCGKTTSARILARTLNCEKAPIADPCGECQSCRDLARGGSGSVDVIEIDAASHGGVDDARDLRERAFFAPVSSRYKVYIIDEAHMVSTQGFNALLKLVEEPPEHLRFIFATTEPEKVIATIRSRTHHYPFRLIPPRVLSDYLAEICDAEGVQIDQAALPLVVRAGAGSARDSLSVLDQLIGGAGPQGVTYDVATSLLGYTPDNLLDEVVDAFAAQDGSGVFQVVDKVIESGQDPRRFTEDVLRRLRDLVIVAAVPDAPATGLIDAPGDQAERLVAQAARFGKAELVRAADIVAAGLTEMRGATTPRLLLELVCARVLLPAASHDELGFGARLDRLERRASVTGAAPSAAVQPAAAPAPQVDRPVQRRPEPAATLPQPPSEEAPREEPRARTPAPETRAETSPETSRAPVASAAAPVPEAPAQAPAQAPAANQSAPGAQGPLSLADVRRIWPDLLEQVKKMRRFTWILLSQNAQVIGVDAKTLTVGFKNAGARESFVGGGSEEILRQAAIDMIGADWVVETTVDQSAQPGQETAPRVSKPAVEERPAPAAPAAQEAAPREAPPMHPQAPPPFVVADADADVQRDDPPADDGLDGAELLARELGATVIEETTHD
jgi:DNA polymerase-3 subunit gamma/tau